MTEKANFHSLKRALVGEGWGGEDLGGGAGSLVPYWEGRLFLRKPKDGREVYRKKKPPSRE